MTHSELGFTELLGAIGIPALIVDEKTTAADLDAFLGAVPTKPSALPALTAALKGMTLSEIASVVRSDWEKVYFGAVPYLAALGTLNTISDAYGEDSGASIVIYFLANANSWRGATARAVKAELNKRYKGGK